MTKAAAAACILIALTATGLDAGSITLLAGTRGQVVSSAESYLGTSYRYGGVDRRGVDCSGLVSAVYNPLVENPLPRTVGDLIDAGVTVDGPIRPGDLLFFDTVGGPSHVGIAIDERRFIHSASAGPNTGVIVSSLDEPYYNKRFLQARSVLPQIDRSSGMLLLFEIDSQAVEGTVDKRLRSGDPLNISVRSGRTDLRFVRLTARKDGQVVLAKRIRISPGKPTTPLLIVPSDGLWELQLQWRDEGLALLRFQAGGLP